MAEFFVVTKKEWGVATAYILAECGHYNYLFSLYSSLTRCSGLARDYKNS